MDTELISFIEEKISTSNFIDIGLLLDKLKSSNFDDYKKVKLLNKVYYHNLNLIRMVEYQNEKLSSNGEYNLENKSYKTFGLPTCDTSSTESKIFIPKIDNIDIIFRNVSSFESYDQISDYLKFNISDNYEETINALISKVLVEIIAIKKLKYEELFSSGSDSVIFDEELKKEELLLNYFYKLKTSTNIITDKPKNNLIYLTTECDNISISNDLKCIPIEFYDSFYSLLSSIQQGNFKRFKRIGNESSGFKNNLLQVRENFTRVIFDQIDSDVYIILTIFLKKVSTSKDYFINLRNVDNLLQKRLPYIKDQLQNNRDLFLNYNNQITDELFTKLLTKDGRLDLDGKVYVKS